jgi:hypothetical protein
VKGSLDALQLLLFGLAGGLAGVAATIPLIKKNLSRQKTGEMSATAAGPPASSPGHPSDRRPLNPCQDSGARVCAQRRAIGAPLPLILTGLQDAGAGGMALLAARALPLTLRRVARAVGRGVECAPAPTWPEGAKGRQPAPGAPQSPRTQASCRRLLRRLTVSACGARRFCMCRGQPRPGALRAPLMLVKKLLTPWRAC